MKTAAIILATTLAASSAAAQGRGLGVGAEGSLGSGAIVGGGGPTVVYDIDLLYIEGGLAFAVGEGHDAVSLGAGCYYKLVTTEASDFSIGGGAALLFVDPDTPRGNADLGLSLNLGAKIRAFVVPNVALQVGLGLNILLDDNNEQFTFASQLGGNAGLVFFF